jgi:hypothetical protein
VCVIPCGFARSRATRLGPNPEPSAASELETGRNSSLRSAAPRFGLEPVSRAGDQARWRPALADGDQRAIYGPAGRGGAWRRAATRAAGPAGGARPGPSRPRGTRRSSCRGRGAGGEPLRTSKRILDSRLFAIYSRIITADSRRPRGTRRSGRGDAGRGARTNGSWILRRNKWCAPAILSAEGIRTHRQGNKKTYIGTSKNHLPSLLLRIL